MRIRNHANRQYPPPRAPWVMAMTWRDLLFMHWRVGPGVLRPFVPPGFVIETFDGSAWLGVVPFEMVGTRARCAPPIPGVSRFPELNVRTYVRAEASGRPGVWFFSLDASQPLAVAAARRSYHLAYMNASMSIARSGEGVEFRSTRTGPNKTLAYGETRSESADLLVRYRPVDAERIYSQGSLESFLTDRYCLFAWGRNQRLYRAEIHHEPWPLRTASAETEASTMGAQLGLDLAGMGPPLLHFAREMHVRAWWPEREG